MIYRSYVGHVLGLRQTIFLANNFVNGVGIRKPGVGLRSVTENFPNRDAVCPDVTLGAVCAVFDDFGGSPDAVVKSVNVRKMSNPIQSISLTI